MRAVPPSSGTSGAGGAGGFTAISAAYSASASNGSADGGGVTTNSGSRPRSRTSTEPGARSLVISSAAADRAFSRVSRAADSSGAVRRSARARASSPPASAATASSCRSWSTYCVRFMTP